MGGCVDAAFGAHLLDISQKHCTSMMSVLTGCIPHLDHDDHIRLDAFDSHASHQAAAYVCKQLGLECAEVWAIGPDG